MEVFNVEKLIYGNDGQLRFDNKEQYYETVGALCNQDIFRITYEENKKTNSYTDAYRIRCKIEENELLSPLQKAVMSQNRVNCNEFVEQLLEKHNFKLECKQKLVHCSYQNVMKTIPDRYVDAFQTGYMRYREKSESTT